MNTHTPNYGQSVKTRLLNLAQQKNIRYQQLVTRYFQERLLFRLSLSEYRSHFVLKGGALLYAYDRFAARPTLDIDFMGDRISNDLENIKTVFRSICDIPYEADGVHFHADTLTADTITVEKEYPGIRVSLIVTLDTIRQSIYMDIGFGDTVIPKPQNWTILYCWLISRQPTLWPIPWRQSLQKSSKQWLSVQLSIVE